ncbi:MAG: hypothetical protein HY976_03175 [Candidatus Kerfeldbacteria bacterium]|nr:hypothetical protein [Candidatus Kerfeldbacteria bacterium]
MPDINLLGDTKDQTGSGDPKKRRAVPPPPVELSSPQAFGSSDRPLKKPSSFGLWIRSAFRGRGNKSSKAAPVPVPAPRTPKAGTPAAIKPGAEPVDIFADLGNEAGGPTKTKARVESAAPTGPRPGEFPPLPTMPAWKAPTGTPAPVSTPARPAPTSPLPPPSMTRSGPVVIGPDAANRRPPPPAARPTTGLPPASGLRIPSLSAVKPIRQNVSDDPAMNLLPDDLVTSYDPKKKLNTIILVAVAAALVVGIIDVSLLLWKETVTRKASEKSTEASVVEAQIKSKELQDNRQAAVVLRESNRTLKKLLDTHIYWTKFLAYFEKYTLSTVKFPSGVSASPGGTLSLTGSAPDLATVVAQLKVYQKATDFITSATINSVARDVKKGTFTFIVDISFKPDVLYDPISPPTASGTNTNANSNLNRNTNASL